MSFGKLNRINAARVMQLKTRERVRSRNAGFVANAGEGHAE